MEGWSLPGSEGDASLDVGLQSLIALFEELLLVVIGFGEDVDGLLCAVGLERFSMNIRVCGFGETYSELNRD